MESLFIHQELIPKFSDKNFPPSKNPKIIHKNTISYNKYKTPRLHSNLSNDLFRTGDRFIPFKNDKENFQNFLLHTPIPNVNENTINSNTNFFNANVTSNLNNNTGNNTNEQELLSPLEEKPEKNYANFIVDNMLRTNSDNYNFQKGKERKFRSNSIFTFSKKVSFTSVNFSSSNNDNNTNKNILKNNESNNNNIFSNKLRNSSNNNTQQKEKEKESNSLFDNIKIDISLSSKEKEKEKISYKNNNTINTLMKSNKSKKSKSKNKNNINNNINNINPINNISSLLYEPDVLNINRIKNTNTNLFNENTSSDDFSRNDILFQYIDNTSNKRNILPDSDFLLANYSINPSFKRKINLTPERILDAPNLVDDYYLNLLEWGSSNLLAVALGPEIYLYNGDTSETSLLMSIMKEENNNTSNSLLNNTNNVITSLSWMNNGVGIGIGLPNGMLELWDVNKATKIREIEAHSDRISSLAWNGYIVTTGSKDKVIKNFDVRIQESEISKIRQHKQEVCALRYSPEGDLLASGGNDNSAYIWDVRKLNNKLINISNLNELNNSNNSIKPLYVNNFHTAAVKALAWCPWQRHVLATGGGSKDRTIKIFNCDNNKIVKNVDTGSQVCSLVWNKKEREIISSHGFNKNQITIWNYQKMKKICELKGHMSRVLYLTISPDENYICSGSGDETLRFWKINDGIQEAQNEEDPLLSNVIIR